MSRKISSVTSFSVIVSVVYLTVYLLSSYSLLRALVQTLSVLFLSYSIASSPPPLHLFFDFSFCNDFIPVVLVFVEFYGGICKIGYIA